MSPANCRIPERIGCRPFCTFELASRVASSPEARSTSFIASSVSSRRNAPETVDAEKESLRAVSRTERKEKTVSAINSAPRYKVSSFQTANPEKVEIRLGDHRVCTNTSTLLADPPTLLRKGLNHFDV